MQNPGTRTKQTIAVVIAVALVIGLAAHWPVGAAKRMADPSGVSIDAYLPLHPYARSLADWMPAGR